MSAVSERTVWVRVPATSANLGPGFDTLGLALSVYDRLTVTALDSDALEIEVTGTGAEEIARDESNLVARSIWHVYAQLGIEPPGLRIIAHNEIPHGRGLGSSGSAVVSGILAAKGLLAGAAELSADDLLRLATELEGHPDNVAPALFGGLTIAWVDHGVPQHKKLLVHRGVLTAGVRAVLHDVHVRGARTAAGPGLARGRRVQPLALRAADRGADAEPRTAAGGDR